MALYDSLSRSYDLVFPLREAKIRYVRALAARAAGAVLDIGCATGSLALEAASEGLEVTGIDLDADMVRLASDRAARRRLPARFLVMDMRRVAEQFPAASFGCILCLGNTVVHLSGPQEIRAFLLSLGSLLAPAGRAAMQLVDYGRVISGEAAGLPTIDNEHARFVRSYRYDPAKHRVLFATELTWKADGTTHRDETELYPLTHAELEGMLPGCGLAMESCHADFSGRPFTEADGSFIAVLRSASS